MSWPNHGYTGAVLPRPSIRSIRPLDRCCSIAYSSAMRTGSLVVISVVAVVTISFFVVAAMNASSVVGADEKNGGLWCSPMANTSRPTSSVFCAICTIASIRSASVGVSPDTGSRVMSLTEKIPNCMACLHGLRYMRLHVSPATRRTGLFRRGYDLGGAGAGAGGVKDGGGRYGVPGVDRDRLGAADRGGERG